MRKPFPKFALALVLVAGAFAPSAYADLFLKQSTASQAVKLGPFIDDTDGKTAETALTIANTDVRLSKNGGTFASKNSGGCTHDAIGYYTCTFDATDTNTAGRLQVAVSVAGALPVYSEYNVVSAAVYDGFYGTSALGYIANAPVNVAQFGGTNGTFAAGVPAVNATQWGGTAVASATVNANATQISGDATVADRFEALFDGTCGSYPEQGITRGVSCTAQAYTAGTPSITLDAAAAFGDNTLTGSTILICGSTQGYCQAASIASNVGSTDVVTLSAAVPTTPTGTITYTIFGTAPSSGSGGGLDAPGMRAALGMASANLDTQLSTIAGYIDTEVAAIKTKTDFLPSATAGAAGGVFIAGTNAATTITTGLTANITGNLSGSVGSVTGAVGSVTGNVGGNVTGSVGSVATGGITAASIATDAIGAAELAADAVTEIQTGLATSSGLSSVALSAASIDAIWDEPKSGHVTAGTYGLYLDAAISGVSTGGVSAATIADAVWDEVLSGHLTASTTGAALNTASSASGLDASGVRAALGMSSANLDTQLSTIAGYVDTEVAAIKTKTDFLPSATAGAAGGVFIAGTNAATTITTGLTANITGNLSGSVGSVTGNVGGNVTGSVGSVSSGGITAASIATDAIGAAELAADAVTEIQSGLATTSGLSSVALSAASIDAIWDEAKAGHNTAGTYGFYLDSAISGVSTGGVSAATIADAVWDEARVGHTTGGTFGFYLDSAISGVSGGGGLDAAAVRAALGMSSANLDTQLAALQSDTDNLQTRLPTSLVSGRIDSSVGAIPMTISEPAGKPSWSSSSLAQWIAWIGAWTRNEVQQTSSQKILRNDADNANLVTCAVSDNGTTFEVSECSP